jgi:hypothetical protein
MDARSFPCLRKEFVASICSKSLARVFLAGFPVGNEAAKNPLGSLFVV